MRVRSAALAASALSALFCAGPSRAGEYEWWHTQIGVNATVQKQAYDGYGTRISVLDTGTNTRHPDLKGAAETWSSTSLVGGNWASDSVGHGTAVASVALGRRNGKGMVGVAPRAALSTVKISANGSSSLGTIAQGIRYAADKGAHVINLSFGYNGWTAESLYDSGLHSALQHAAGKSVIVISAGNDGQVKLNGLAMHLLLNGVVGSGIIAGSVSAQNQASSFTNLPGDWQWDGTLARDFYLDAPGENIKVASGNSGYRLASGTSFSAPMIAGAAALVRSLHTFLTPQQVVEILLRSAQDLGAAGTDGVYGRGLLRVDQALAPIGTTSVATGATVSGASHTADGSTILVASSAGSLDRVRQALAKAVIFDEYGRDFAADLGARIGTRSSGAFQPSRLFAEQGRKQTIRSDFASGTWFQASGDRDTPPSRAGELTPVRRFTADPSSSTDKRFDAWMMGGRLGLADFAVGFGPGASSLLDLDGGPESALFLTGGAEAAQPVLALAEGGWHGRIGYRLDDTLKIGVSMSQTRHEALDLGLTSRANALSVQMRWQPVEGVSLDFTPSFLTEKEGALASLSSGALDLGEGTRTVSLGFGASFRFGERLSLRLHVTEAVSTLDTAQDSLFRDIGAVRSRAFGASLTREGIFDDDDALGLSVTKPLRIHAGSGSLDVPVGRDDAGNVFYERERVSLAPSGSQTDLELSYRRSLAEGVDGSLNLVHQSDLGHVRGESNTALLARIRGAF